MTIHRLARAVQLLGDRRKSCSKLRDLVDGIRRDAPTVIEGEIAVLETRRRAPNMKALGPRDQEAAGEPKRAR